MENNNNTLAKISLAMSGILLILVIILFFRSPSGAVETAESDGESSETAMVTPPNGNGIRIGYYNQDSLNANADFVKEIESDIAKAQQDAEGKMARHQKKIDDWQKKWASKGQLLTSEQERYMKEAEQMQMEAMQVEQQIQMELGQEQERLMITLVTRITNFAKIFAEKEGYDMIMSYTLGQNPVYMHPSMDITKKLVKLLNDDFNSGFTGLEEEPAGQSAE